MTQHQQVYFVILTTVMFCSPTTSYAIPLLCLKEQSVTSICQYSSLSSDLSLHQLLHFNDYVQVPPKIYARTASCAA